MDDIPIIRVYQDRPSFLFAEFHLVHAPPRFGFLHLPHARSAIPSGMDVDVDTSRELLFPISGRKYWQRRHRGGVRAGIAAFWPTRHQDKSNLRYHIFYACDRACDRDESDKFAPCSALDRVPLARA